MAEKAREREHGKFREAIDDANDVLSKPFAWITEDSSSLWVQRGVTVVLGVVIFGLGGAWLANLIPKSRQREPAAWQS